MKNSMNNVPPLSQLSAYGAAWNLQSVLIQRMLSFNVYSL